MSVLNQTLVKDGATLKGDDNLAELKIQAAEWGARTLPVWEALGV